MEQRHLHALYRRERLHPGDSGQAHRHRLPLLPQQPHGHHLDQARAEEMGGLCARQRHADSVRCRLRSLHPRRRRAPLHLRDKGSEEMRHRVPQLLEDCRIHGSTLRLHRCAERTHCRHAGRRTHPAEQALEPPPIYQVQRHQLHHPAGGGSHLHTGGTAADKGNDRLLYGQCPDHEAGP